MKTFKESNLHHLFTLYYPQYPKGSNVADFYVGVFTKVYTWKKELLGVRTVGIIAVPSMRDICI